MTEKKIQYQQVFDFQNIKVKLIYEIVKKVDDKLFQSKENWKNQVTI